MNDYLLGLYEKATPLEISWEERFAAARKAGFDFLEISIDESDERLSRLDWTQKEREEVLMQSKKAGLAIRTICLSGHRKYPLGSVDEETQKKSLEIMSKAVDLAVDLGVRIIQLAGYDVYYQESTSETREIFIKNLQKAVLLAAKKGVLLGLETMENDFMNTVEKAMYFVKKIDSPYLNVYPDTGNIRNAVDCLPKDVLQGKGKIIAAHLKETVEGVFRDMMFGDGRVDFIEAISTYRSIGVRMFLAEFWYKGEEDWETRLKYANDSLRDKFTKVIANEGTHI